MILQDIEVLATDAKDNPILKTYYREALLDEVHQHIAKALNLSYMDVIEVIDEDFIRTHIEV